MKQYVVYQKGSGCFPQLKAFLNFVSCLWVIGGYESILKHSLKVLPISKFIRQKRRFCPMDSISIDSHIYIGEWSGLISNPLFNLIHAFDILFIIKKSIRFVVLLLSVGQYRCRLHDFSSGFQNCFIQCLSLRSAQMGSPVSTFRIKVSTLMNFGWCFAIRFL